MCSAAATFVQPASGLGLPRLNRHPDLSLADGDVDRLNVAELDRVHLLALRIDPRDRAVAVRHPERALAVGDGDGPLADRDDAAWRDAAVVRDVEPNQRVL